MSSFSKLFLIITCFICLSSCHKDSDDDLTSDYLLGVWEYENEDEVDGTTYIFQLVLGPNDLAGEIVRLESSTGEVTSSFNELIWNKINDVIVVEDSTTSGSYVLNSGNKLISKTNENLVLIKISQDYSLYLGE
ncbi:hypothetical protein PW52_14505 [Tamlana sedimentorum]|uniref:Lipocalin-like domain-containing protein n=1 Tax=Neotamlana sedimentorum TaxID=1435349 RepID=A0A0D7W2B7_9FLAO|nr:hypothetical protein [Tamlana sedimentorum]KJD33250.1 hypothetical protein PW52_14505 [Tamlana sedimentorum]